MDVFRKISRLKVKGMKLGKLFLNFLRDNLRVKKLKLNEHGPHAYTQGL